MHIRAVDETQYLIFGLEAEGLYEAYKEKIFDVIDKGVSGIISRIGTVGSGKTRKMGFMIVIPPWIVEKAFPGKIEIVVREAFNIAEKRNIAVHFTVESHYLWETRPDLWNYFDPDKPGYNPENIKNVEWMDWKGTPFPGRYMDWGTPQKFAPHMCYNSPQVIAEISRLAMKIVAPPILAGLNGLKRVGKEHLFSGITVGSEPSLDNYTNMDKINPRLGRFMDKHKAPKVRLGYNALRNVGYSEKNPPKDFARALGEINRDFIAFWAKQFVDAGIPSSRLYTHIAANAGPAVDFTNAPIWVAFNDYSRPGWTTYPDGPLAKDFSVLYEELEKHGNPLWGGTEANPFGLSGTKVPVGKYISRHFDHGATLMVFNTGATSSELTERLVEGAWGSEAIATYKKFFSNKKA